MMTPGEVTAVSMLDALLANAGEAGPLPVDLAAALGLCCGLLPPEKVVELTGMFMNALRADGASTVLIAQQARLICARETPSCTP